MREIKFRAWSKEHKEMVPSYALPLDYQGEVMFGLKHIGVRPDNPDYKLMQYTGLKDKNGKEIYEGDICNVDGPIAEVKYFTDLNWDSGGSQHPGFWFNFDFMRDNELTYHDGFDDCEVIGNIYENPELLGEANT